MLLDAYGKDLLRTRAYSRKMSNTSGMLKEPTIVYKFMDGFYIHFQVKMIFSTTPTYQKFIDLNIPYTKLMSYNYPVRSDWGGCLNYPLSFLDSIIRIQLEKRTSEQKLLDLCLIFFYFYEFVPRKFILQQ